MRAAAAGRGRLAVIGGPAGIGKSGLLADLRARAGDALHVLPARASELEREFGFGVVRQLFEGLVADPARGPAALAGAAAPAAAVFDAPDAGEGEGLASFAALHGLFWLSANLAGQRPLLLAVDDLHWCDRPSLRFLAYLARRLEGLPILIAATVRSGEPGTDPTLLAEVVHDPGALTLLPGPLSEAGAAALVRARLGAVADDAFCAACHDATGGNPLLLRQLLRALEAEGVVPDAGQIDVVRAVGPRAASSTVLVRLGRLPGEAAAVARAVSVLGESAELPAVAALAGLDEPAVAAATGALARDRDPPRRPAARLRPPARPRCDLPRAAAGRARAPARARGAPAAGCRRRTRAGRGPAAGGAAARRAVGRGAAEETGRTAMRRGAADSAVAYLRRALEEPPPPERRTGVLLSLGTAEALTNGPAAAEHLRAAYDGLADPVMRARVADGLARALIFTGRPLEAAELTRRAAAELPPGHEELRDMLDALELTTLYIGDMRPELLDRVARHRDPDASPPPLLAIAAHDWSHRGGSADDCCRLALAALRRGNLIERENGTFSISALSVLGLADRDEAVAGWDASLEAAHRHGSLFSVASVHLFYGMALLWRGDLAGAAELLRAGKEEFHTWGFGSTGQLYLDAHLVRVATEQGDLAGARRILEQSPRGDGRSDGDRYCLNAELHLLAAEGRWEDVLGAAADLRRRFGMYTSPSASRWRSVSAEALERLGRHAEAVALAEEELAHARTWGAPGALGNALRVLGRLTGGADGLAQLEQSVVVLRGSPARLELAKALAALGGALRRERRPSEAREPLRGALELAVACDAPGLAEDVRTELYATGARPRTDALAGVAALTASERRVVDRAATGATNRDIAQALFVTPKTVEVHLSNAYRKLGVRSRRELPEAIGAIP